MADSGRGNAAYPPGGAAGAGRGVMATFENASPVGVRVPARKGGTQTHIHTRGNDFGEVGDGGDGGMAQVQPWTSSFALASDFRGGYVEGEDETGRHVYQLSSSLQRNHLLFQGMGVGLDNHSEHSPFRVVDSSLAHNTLSEYRNSLTPGPVYFGDAREGQRLTPGAAPEVPEYALGLENEHLDQTAASFGTQGMVYNRLQVLSPSLLQMQIQQRTSPDLIGMVDDVIQQDQGLGQFYQHMYQGRQHYNSADTGVLGAGITSRNTFASDSDLVVQQHHAPIQSYDQKRYGADASVYESGVWNTTGSGSNVSARYSSSVGANVIDPAVGEPDGGNEMNTVTAGFRGLNVNAQPYMAGYLPNRPTQPYSQAAAPDPGNGAMGSHQLYTQIPQPQFQHFSGQMPRSGYYDSARGNLDVNTGFDYGPGNVQTHPQGPIPMPVQYMDPRAYPGVGVAKHPTYSQMEPNPPSNVQTYAHSIQAQLWWQQQSTMSGSVSNIRGPVPALQTEFALSEPYHSTHPLASTSRAGPDASSAIVMPHVSHTGELTSVTVSGQQYMHMVQPSPGATTAGPQSRRESSSGPGSRHSSDSEDNSHYSRFHQQIGYRHTVSRSNSMRERDERRKSGGSSSSGPTGKSSRTVLGTSGGRGMYGSGEGGGMSKRSELVESPHTKSAYKDFYRQFRMKEREGMECASRYAKDALQWMPEKSKWRVYLELADLAKRSNQVSDARKLYKKVCVLQPLASQGWLEWSKMEEECGHLFEALTILKRGLKECHFNESLLTKAIKQEERLHNLDGARGLLARLKHEDVDKVWRAVLEGALLEARAGNTDIARHFLFFLMANVPWYGPIYFEAYRLEEKEGDFMTAMSIIKRGLDELPRYGPLWFGLLRLSERVDIDEEMSGWRVGHVPLLRRVREACMRAVRTISKELVWKVYFETAQAEERAVDMCACGRGQLQGVSPEKFRNPLLEQARLCYCKSVLACPPNLRWKVWVAGARLEAGAGRMDFAQQLIKRAFAEVPDKSRPYVYLECSRMEEFQGNLDGARRVLTIGRQTSGEWKIFLETVMLESRAGMWSSAVRSNISSLQLFPGTGRLWAMLLQIAHRLHAFTHPHWYIYVHTLIKGHAPAAPLSHIESPEEVFLKALSAVPKSGEVWCEGARTHLNPLVCEKFDLGTAQQFLNFAIQFTPQYGDSFIEYLRLEIIMQGMLPLVLGCLGVNVKWFMRTFLNKDADGDSHVYIQKMDDTLPVVISNESIEALACDTLAYKAELGLNGPSLHNIELSKLRRRCLNADPNYGSLWFFSRRRPFDTPNAVLDSALHMCVHELTSTDTVYAKAILAYVRRCLTTYLQQHTHTHTQAAEGTPNLALTLTLSRVLECMNRGEERATQVLRAALQAQGCEEGVESTCASVAWGSVCVCVCDAGVYTAADFVTGIIALNRTLFNKYLSQEDRRQVLFGSDQIVA